MVSDELFNDLTVLEQSSFPKTCPTCGAIYNSIDDFTTKTQHVNGKSGLKSTEGDEGETILELFRNCKCGSTLLDFFANRRDNSEKADKKRETFDRIVEKLAKHNIDTAKAKQELRQYIKVGKSELLEKLGVFKLRINK